MSTTTKTKQVPSTPSVLTPSEHLAVARETLALCEDTLASAEGSLAKAQDQVAAGDAGHHELRDAQGAVEVASIRRDAAVQAVSDAEAAVTIARKRSAATDVLAVAVAAIESVVGKAGRVVTDKPDPDAVDYPTLYVAANPRDITFDRTPGFVNGTVTVTAYHVLGTWWEGLVDGRHGSSPALKRGTYAAGDLFEGWLTSGPNGAATLRLTVVPHLPVLRHRAWDDTIRSNVAMKVGAVAKREVPEAHPAEEPVRLTIDTDGATIPAPSNTSGLGTSVQVLDYQEHEESRRYSIRVTAHGGAIVGADSSRLVVGPARVVRVLESLAGAIISGVGRVTDVANAATTQDGATAVVTIEARTDYPEAV